MYRKFRNVPIFKDIPPICSYFLGFRVGKYANPRMKPVFIQFIIMKKFMKIVKICSKSPGLWYRNKIPSFIICGSTCVVIYDLDS